MTDVASLHKKLWRPGYGSVSASEAAFIAGYIQRKLPGLFVEIGTATGLSTVIIYTALQEAGIGRAVTLDYSKTFYGDKSKPTGFVIDEHLGHTPDKITRITEVTSVDLRDALPGQEIDMVFIDANHAHPWPTLDVLMVWPMLANDASLFLHDIRNYQRHADRRGIGPKYLYDSFPDVCKETSDDKNPNICRIDRSAISDADFVSRMCDCLQMPWEQAGRVEFTIAHRIYDNLRRQYPASIAGTFAAGMNRK